METPLTCKIEGDCLVVRIGIGTLAGAATNCEHFWDGESGTDVPCIKIDDDRLFAEEVARYLTVEEEDGSTLLTGVINQAIINAVEDGCDGVDHEV
jgi:hypothetical protein